MCGHANMAPYLLRWTRNLTLNDISPAMLAHIDEHIRSQCHVLPACDSAHLALDDESMDLIVFSGGLHHVHQNILDVLREALRILKPNGLLLFGEPSNEFLPVRLLRNSIYRLSSSFDHRTERAFQWAQLRGYLQDAGFSQISIRPFGSIGYLLMGQVSVIPLLKNLRSHRLFDALNRIDRMVEKSRWLCRSCFALVGSATKTTADGQGCERPAKNDATSSCLVSRA
jgi:ubiquinone/menaquinone biosynthesis C-methylase UbiE